MIIIVRKHILFSKTPRLLSACKLAREEERQTSTLLRALDFVNVNVLTILLIFENEISYIQAPTKRLIVVL